MSAGASSGATVVRSLDVLAPLFRGRVEAILADCATQGLDAMVYESYRSLELAQLYYTRGRPPSAEYPRPVTNAKDNLHSWHGYGLAVDMISRAKEWGAGDAWFTQLGAIAKAHSCTWGGDWHMRDLPHVQMGVILASPTEEDRALIVASGMEAVWAKYGLFVEVP